MIPCRPPEFLRRGMPCSHKNAQNTPREHLILGSSFLATSHARINVFEKEISLGINNDRVVFKMNHVLCDKDNEVASSSWVKTSFETFQFQFKKANKAARTAIYHLPHPAKSKSSILLKSARNHRFPFLFPRFYHRSAGSYPAAYHDLNTNLSFYLLHTAPALHQAANTRTPSNAFRARGALPPLFHCAKILPFKTTPLNKARRQKGAGF